MVNESTEFFDRTEFIIIRDCGEHVKIIIISRKQTSLQLFVVCEFKPQLGFHLNKKIKPEQNDCAEWLVLIIKT